MRLELKTGASIIEIADTRIQFRSYVVDIPMVEWLWQWQIEVVNRQIVGRLTEQM